MTAERRTFTLCRDCRAFHGEAKSAAGFCTCAVLDAEQASCSCDGAVIRAAAGLRGWGVYPGSEVVVVLTDAPCQGCERDLGFGAQYRMRAFSLTPAPRNPEAPILPGTAASREAWAKAASPASRAAMTTIAEQQGTGT